MARSYTYNPITLVDGATPVAGDGRSVVPGALDSNGNSVPESRVAPSYTDVTGATAGGVIGLLKGIFAKLAGATGGTTPVTIKNNIILASVVPVVSAAGAYAAGNLLFDVTAIPNAVLNNGDGCWIDSITLIDKDAQNAAMDLYVCQGNTTLGALRAAPTISAANWAANVPVRVGQVGTGDWSTVKAGLSTATINLGKMLQAPSAGTTLYIAAVAQSAATYTNAANLSLEIGIGR